MNVALASLKLTLQTKQGSLEIMPFPLPERQEQKHEPPRTAKTLQTKLKDHVQTRSLKSFRQITCIRETH